jgi:hypothetical protein
VGSPTFLELSSSSVQSKPLTLGGAIMLQMPTQTNLREPPIHIQGVQSDRTNCHRQVKAKLPLPFHENSLGKIHPAKWLVRLGT